MFRRDERPTDSLTTRVVAERLAKVHPKVGKKVRPTAKYVSAHLQEYEIYHDGSLWRVMAYKGGDLPPYLRGGWMSIVECEAVLINFLRSKDKFGKAIYPGCPAQLRISSTEPSSKG